MKHRLLQPPIAYCGDFIDDVSEVLVRDSGGSEDVGRNENEPTDLADVSGDTYTYLMNWAKPPNGNWTGILKPGEKLRLRFINGSAWLPTSVSQA